MPRYRRRKPGETDDEHAAGRDAMLRSALKERVKIEWRE